MATKIKIELEQNKLHLEFYKARNAQVPNTIYAKWVEIYADRVKMLEKQLAKEEKRQQQLAMAASAAAVPAKIISQKAAAKSKSRSSARR